MVWRNVLLTPCSLLLFSLLGCAEARLITHDQYGGVVSIPANSDRWPSYNRKNAEEIMSKQCPEGYIIENEYEVPVGPQQPAQTGAPKVKSTYNVIVSGNDVQDTNKPKSTQYLIRFRSKNAPPVGVPSKDQAVSVQTIIPLLPPVPADTPPEQTDIKQTGGELPKQPLPPSP